MMKLQPISTCPSGFGQYQPTLGSSPFTARVTQKIRRVKSAEGNVQNGGNSMVVSIGDENTETWNGEIAGLFVWENDTPKRVEAARKSGQLIECSRG